MVTSAALQELQAFQSKLYDCCTRRRDALFELVDALLTADSSPSLAYLSLEPIHRRGWAGTDAALATGQVDAQALPTLLACQQLAGGQPIDAVDVSTWPRCEAEASPERGFYYHPSRHSAGQPIVAGWRFSGSLSWGWPVTAGPPRSTPAGCTHATTPTRSPSPRFTRWWSDGPPARGRCCGRRRLRPRSARPRAGRHRRGDPGVAARWPLVLRRPATSTRSPKGGRPRRHGPSSTPTTRPAGRRRPQRRSATTASSAP